MNGAVSSLRYGIGLSYILGHLSTILQQPASLISPDSAAGPIIARTILGEMDRFRESVESLLFDTPNLVHLCYWHVRLLVLSVTSSTDPHELLPPAAKIASILNQPGAVITAFNHQFAALAALVLMELSRAEETRREAEQGMDDLLEAQYRQRGLILRAEGPGWWGLVHELLVRTRSDQNVRCAANDSAPISPQGGATGVGGLQHLADAAIRGHGDRGSPAEVAGQSGTASSSVPFAFNSTAIVRYGYLRALVHQSTAQN